LPHLLRLSLIRSPPPPPFPPFPTRRSSDLLIGLSSFGSRALIAHSASSLFREFAAPQGPGSTRHMAGGAAETFVPEGTGGHTSRSEEHTSELQSHLNLVCRLLLEKKKTNELNDTPQGLIDNHGRHPTQPQRMRR